MAHWLHRPRRRTRVVVFVSLAIVLAVWLRRPLFQGNFGVVEAGRAYRAAQPGASLEALVQDHQLRSIVNLRGGSPSDGFYAHETEVADREGLEFYDLPMAATRRPMRVELLRILELFRVCRYPLLIHCKWGSDRTGLVSALYRLSIAGEPPEKAIDAFSLSYGHVPLFGPQRLHEPIAEYASWLRNARLSHSPARFRAWVEREYRAEDPFRGTPEVSPGSRLPRAAEHRPAFAGRGAQAEARK